MTKSSSRSIQHHPYREIIMDSENIANDGAALAEAMCGVIWAELPRWTLISLTGFGHSRDCCGGEHGPTTLSDLFDSWTFIEEAMALLGWGDGEWDPSSEAEAARINAAISLVDLLISEFPDPLVDYSTNDTYTAGVINDMLVDCPECGVELVQGDPEAWCHLGNECNWYGVEAKEAQ